MKLLYLACRYLLLVIDEVGYILFEPEAVNLFFHVSSRHERASVIVTSSNHSAARAKSSPTKWSPQP